MTTEEFIKAAQVYYYTRAIIATELGENIFNNILNEDIKLECIKYKIDNSDLQFYEFLYLQNNLDLLKRYFRSLISLGDELCKPWFNQVNLETQFLWYTILKKDYEDCEELKDFEYHWITNWYNNEYKVKWINKQIDSILNDE